MLKLFIATSLSIASLLSLASIADAGSINQKSAQHSTAQTQLHLSAKQPQSNVSASDLKGINQAIAQYFREKNNKEMPSSPTDSKPVCWFFEVKSLRLVSFADNKAEILTKVRAQGYEIKRIGTNPVRWNYEKTAAQIEGKYEHSILLTKSNGKWKVSSSVV
jgi:hypothetical protein